MILYVLIHYLKVYFKFRVRKFMKLLKSLLVTPATLGLLAPMFTANEVAISDFTPAEQLAITNSRVDGLRQDLTTLKLVASTKQQLHHSQLISVLVLLTVKTSSLLLMEMRIFRLFMVFRLTALVSLEKIHLMFLLMLVTLIQIQMARQDHLLSLI